MFRRRTFRTRDSVLNKQVELTRRRYRAMFRQINSFGLVAITIGVLMSCSVPALAAKQTSFAERYENNTGEPAKCLKKYVGKYTVNKAISDIGPCTITEVGDYFVITCAGSQVENGDTARVTAFGTPASSKAEVLCAKWYSDATCSTFEGYATPVPNVTATTESNLTVTVEHAAKEVVNDVTGETGDDLPTIHGRDVQYAVAGRFRHMGELNESLFADMSIGWEVLEDFDLVAGASTSYDLGEFDDPAVLLFRFYTEDSPTPGQSGYELLQFCMKGACIPAVTEWGLVIIALLVLAAGTIVIRRRRAMAAQA